MFVLNQQAWESVFPPFNKWDEPLPFKNELLIETFGASWVCCMCDFDILLDLTWLGKYLDW